MTIKIRILTEHSKTWRDQIGRKINCFTFVHKGILCVCVSHSVVSDSATPVC